MDPSQTSYGQENRTSQPGLGLADYVEHVFAGFTELATAGVSTAIISNLPLQSIDSKLGEVLQYVRFLRNAAQPAAQLPAEILGRIFQLVQPGFKNSREYAYGGSWNYRKMHDWMVIRLVCKRWEAIAVATPSLWTYIFLNNSHRDDLETAMLGNNSLPRLHLLRLFIHRSRQLSLSVHIGETFDYLKQSLDEILPQLPRVRELTIIGENTFPHKRLFQALGGSGTPMLQSLVYLAPYDPYESRKPAPLDAPILRSLSLRFHHITRFDNLKNLRQLHISQCYQGIDQLLDFLDSMPLLEDMLLTDLNLKNQPIPPRRPISLPRLKRLAFVDTDCKDINDVLTHMSLPKTTFLASQHRYPNYRNLPSSLQSLDLLVGDALAPYLGLTPVDRITTKLHYYGDEFDNDQRFSLHVANDSFGMRLDIKFPHPRRGVEEQDFAAGVALNLIGTTKELWIDRWCPNSLEPRSSRYEEQVRRCGTSYNFVRSSCGDVIHQAVKKLFCHGEAHEPLLDGLTPNEYVSHPTHMLSELHILTPLPADPECLEKMEKMLKDRRAMDIPLDILYFYLPLEEFSDDELSSWTVAFEQWEVWRPKLEDLVKVEFVRTKTLPRMKVPKFCTEQSEELWKWPTMWDI